MKLALCLGLLTSGVVLAASCADPDGAFDDFVARAASSSTTSSSSGGDGGACTVPAAGEIDGDHLLVLSAKLSPKKPIVMTAKITTADEGGTLMVSMELQPLDAADRATPVGGSITVEAFPVAADGSFTMQVPSADIDGTANPITGNTLTGVTATLTGTLCDPTFFCGTVTGAVTTPPVKLDGSTFTFQPITDPATPPEAYINCAKDLANPLN